MLAVHIVRAFALLLALALVAAMAHAAPPAEAKGEARARAIVEAFSTGDAATYERAAQEHFSPAALARRTPAQRAEMVARVHGDAGALEILEINASSERLTIKTRGAKGPRLGFIFTFDGTPDARIASLGIEMGEPEERAALPPPPVTRAMPQAEFAAKLDAWLAPLVKSDAFAGVVLVAKGGAPVLHKAYGPADREKKAPANTDTAYNVASIGKKFTQVAVAKLVQQGKLKLTTKVGDVIPDYPNAVSRAATVAQLIGMQGGIADFFGPEFVQADKTKFNSNHAYFEFVSKLPPRFAPGAKREYCNGCYVVLGEMVERLSREKFEDFVRANVLSPAGMSRSGYFNSAKPPANVAVPYARLKGPAAPYESTRAMHGVTGSGAGGVYATAKDLLAFDIALRSGRLLNPEMTAWVLNGGTQLGIAGGTPGVNASLESDGTWAVIVVANVSPPVAEHIASAVNRALAR
jgi:CubicO group peptidase (beta-lactamase class C family)